MVKVINMILLKNIFKSHHPMRTTQQTILFKAIRRKVYHLDYLEKKLNKMISLIQEIKKYQDREHIHLKEQKVKKLQLLKVELILYNIMIIIQDQVNILI